MKELDDEYDKCGMDRLRAASFFCRRDQHVRCVLT